VTNTEYGTLSTDELLDTLEHAGRGPDPDLIRACLERCEEITPTLLEMLAEGPEDVWADEDQDPGLYRDIHAGHLLLAFGEEAALPVFGRAFRDKDREYLLDWFESKIPVAYGAAAVPMLVDLLQDTDAYIYPRVAATDMLAYIVQDHPEQREQIVAALRALLPSLDADGNLPPDLEFDEIWTWVATALAGLKDEDSLLLVRALYRADMIDQSVVGSEQQYMAYFHRAARRPPPFDILKVYERLHREAVQEAKRRAREAKREQTVRPAKPRSQPKIGRNDPCPCGSGRKYKHCCGKKR
jgi:uncharacterized protein YecA (UPF0149 family)